TRQPWASLLIKKVKTIENRPAPLSGVPRWMALHASKTAYTSKEKQVISRKIPGVLEHMQKRGSPTGVLLGWVYVERCVPYEKCKGEEWAFPGKTPEKSWCWFVTNVIELAGSQHVHFNGTLTIGYPLPAQARIDLLA